MGTALSISITHVFLDSIVMIIGACIELPQLTPNCPVRASDQTQPSKPGHLELARVGESCGTEALTAFKKRDSLGVLMVGSSLEAVERGGDDFLHGAIERDQAFGSRTLKRVVFRDKFSWRRKTLERRETRVCVPSGAEE